MKLHLRLYFGDTMLGPGKAQMLDLIRDHGSISAAGREMKMSYKRAWGLVEEMNAIFHAPLVDSTRGGPGGGGATVTALGLSVLAHFRAIEQQVLHSPDLAALQTLLRDIPDRK